MASPAKKTTPPRRTRNLRTSHEEKPHDPVREERLRRARVAIAALPPGFKATGFEIIDDSVRVYGEVFSGEPANAVPAGVAGALPGQQIRLTDQACAALLVEVESPLMGALQSCGRRLEELACSIESLAEVANRVLVPEPPAPIQAEGHGSAASAEPAQSQAVTMLWDRVSQIERLISRVNNIRSRVQA